jgi:glycosyltransferase involved in cell wall biosynthesis
MHKKNNLKIWLLTDGEQLPIVSGAKKMRTHRLGEELSKRGHYVTWWASTFFHTGKYSVSEKDITYNISKTFDLKLLDCGVYSKNISLTRILHHYKLGKKFEKESKKMDIPDIIVSSYPTPNFSDKAVRYGLEKNIPIVIDVRDMWPDIFTEYFHPIFHPFINIGSYLMNKSVKKTFEQATSIVSMSPDVLEWALKKTKTKKDGKVFFLSSDSPLENPKQTEKFDFLRKIKKNKIVISFVGTFSKTYDLKTICELAKLIEKDKKDIFFVLAGDGHSFLDLKKSYSYLDNIKLTGWVDNFEYQDLMSLTDICVIPSQATAIPNKFTEALSSGKPILSSCLGVAQTLIKDYNIGYSYKVRDLCSLKKALEDIVGDENYKKMRENVNKLFSLHFDPKNVYSEYADYLESLF